MALFSAINLSRIWQLEGQSFQDFITKLKKLRAECEFENLWDSLIKDMIVCGTNDNVFRERPLRESDLTLSRAISARYAAEETLKHAREIFQSQLPADPQTSSSSSQSKIKRDN